MPPLYGFMPPVARGVSKAAPYSPDEERDILRAALQRGTSGLAWIGETLDKPGRAVRGTLSGLTGGDWGGGALNLIPFSDTLGITDPNEGVSGRDLLEHLGAVDKNRPGLHLTDPNDLFGDVAGFGTEVLLDPLTYLTFGGAALSKGGQVAKRAGILDDAARAFPGLGKRQAGMAATLGDVERAAGKEAPAHVDEALRAMGLGREAVQDKPLRGLFGVGLPFQDPAFVVGTGKRAQQFAGAMDKAGQFVAQSPVGRAARAAFDPAVKGFYRPMEQKLAEMISSRRHIKDASIRESQQMVRDNMDAAFKAFDEVYGERVRGVPGQDASLFSRQPGMDPKMPEGVAFGVGDVVRVGKEDFGYVRNVTPDGATVFFRNPETGETVEKLVPHDKVAPAFPKGTSQAEQYAYDLTYKVFDEVGRLARETSGQHEGFSGGLEHALNKIVPGAKVDQNVADKMNNITSLMASANNLRNSDIEYMGGRVNWIEGYDQYAYEPSFVRKSVRREHQLSEGITARLSPTSHAGMRSREAATRTVPRYIVNQVLTDPKARGADAPQYILQTYGDYLGARELDDTIADPIQRAIQAKADHATELADYVASHKPKQLYTRTRVEDFGTYQSGAAEVQQTLKSVHDLMAAEAVDDLAPPTVKPLGGVQPEDLAPPGMERTLLGGNAINVREGVFVEKVPPGKTPKPEPTEFDQLGPTVKQAYRSAGMDPEQSVEFLAEKLGRPVEEVERMRVPLDVAKAMAAVVPGKGKNEFLEAVGDAIDSSLQWWKNHLTLPFPAFHGRNFLSGQYVNMATGEVTGAADLAKYKDAFKEGWKLRSAPADDPLVREIEILNVMPTFRGAQDISLMRQAEGITPENPFDLKNMMFAQRQQVQGEKTLMSKLPGGEAVQAGIRTGEQAGARVAQNVEWMNRVPMYLYLRKKGWAPQAAAKKVTELHFDYSDLTPMVEKQVMRRIIPFYSFTRKMAPLTMKTLLERPGGVMAQTIRASTAGHDPDVAMPDYVAQGAAIPLGTSDDGTQRYITGFGLPHEDPLSFLGGGVQGGLLEGLSRLHPVPKSALEWATGESLFQRGPAGGRELSDLDPTIGRTLANITGREDPVPTPKSLEFLLANSPASRYLTTARTLTDPRKRADASSLALLAGQMATGFRVTDVSPKVQQARLREFMREAEKELGAKTYEKVYVPKELQEKLAESDPERLARLLRLQAVSDKITKDAQDEARKNKNLGR